MKCLEARYIQIDAWLRVHHSYAPLDNRVSGETRRCMIRVSHKEPWLEQ